MATMATDVITLITKDHRTVESLFERLKAGQGDQKTLVTELHALLIAHAAPRRTGLPGHRRPPRPRGAQGDRGPARRPRTGRARHPGVPHDAGQARRVRQPPRRGRREQNPARAGEVGRRQGAAGARQGVPGAPGGGAEGARRPQAGRPGRLRGGRQQVRAVRTGQKGRHSRTVPDGQGRVGPSSKQGQVIGFRAASWVGGAYDRKTS